MRGVHDSEITVGFFFKEKKYLRKLHLYLNPIQCVNSTDI